MNIDIKKLKPTEVAAYARIVTDVRLWAEAFLMNPDNEQPFRLNHVQHQMLKPGKIKKVIRIHRRGGKSYGLAILALWYALTHQSGQVLIICPDMGKVQTIMRSIDEFLRVSTFIAGELKSATKIPAIREFRNGSTIKGFTTGSSSKTQGKSIRGSTADLVIIDEAAFLNDDDWPAIEPIIQGDSTRPEVITYISSTPTADRNRYWEYCTQPQYEEVFDRVHVPVTENPDYTPDRIAVVKASTNDFTFKQEWMAAFPDIGEGVYKRSYIDRAQREFEYYDPKLPKSIPYPAVRTMGVDWDKYNGTGPNIYILELDRDNQRVKGVYHEEIDPGEYCLTLAVSRIIELNTIFNPQHINVDRGFGEQQVETLHLYGIQHPESGLASKVRGVSFSETVDVIDPITKEHIKKRIKPVMVNITVKWMEDGRFNYPRSHQRFTNQLQDFKIVSITDTAIKYSSEDEHIIDAFMLAAYALYENYEDPFGIDPAINSYLLPVPEYVTETVAKSQAYGYTSDPSPIQKDFSRRKVPKIVYNNTDSNSGLAARRTF